MYDLHQYLKATIRAAVYREDEEKGQTNDEAEMEALVSSSSGWTNKSGKTIYAVEGNIGSGKSTAVNELREHFEGNPRVRFLLEPLSIWESIKDKDGNNMISKFYGDIKRYAFAFQMMAYITRLDLLREALQDEEADIIITERSLLTDKNVFAQMLADDEMLEDVEHQIYLKWFDSFIKDIPKVNVFYVRTDPEVALARLKRRNREGENIELPYIQRVHQYHENWLLCGKTDVPVTVVDGNTDLHSAERPAELLAEIIQNRLLREA